MKLKTTVTVETEITPEEAVQLGQEIMNLSLQNANSPLLKAWLDVTSQAYSSALTQVFQDSAKQAMQNSTHLFWPWFSPKL